MSEEENIDDVEDQNPLISFPEIISPHHFQTKVKIRLEKRKESQDYAKVSSNPNILDNQVKRGWCQERRRSLIHEDICSAGAETLLTVSPYWCSSDSRQAWKAKGNNYNHMCQNQLGN